MKIDIKCVVGLGLAMMLSVSFASEASPGSETKNKPATEPEAVDTLTPKKADKKKDIIYQWVDEEGNTIISDRPHQGATEIEVPKPQTYRPHPSLLEEKLKQNRQKVEQPRIIEVFDQTPPKIRIVAPADESWLENNLGNVQISIAVNPARKRGQQLQIILDGKIIASGALSATASGLDRGTHTISVQVVMQDSGKVIASKESTFNVRRPTIKR